MSEYIPFEEWEMSSDFWDTQPATQIFDAATQDRIGDFRPPIMPPVGTKMLFHGGYAGKVVQVSVDMSAGGSSAAVYVSVELDDHDGFWRYRKAMEQVPPAEPEDAR
ncbi:MAG TPA: hypothetical protein VHT75_20280 [Acidimicrobiales bacterium]|nr:hypothetical protein [Acidimicrobiales bacterium]